MKPHSTIDYQELSKKYYKLREDYEILNKQLITYGKDFKKVFDNFVEQNKRTKAAYLETIHRLSLAAEFKDEDTGDHIYRISCFSALLAKELNLSTEVVENILYASPMHDVGKIGVPDSILLKPGKLTEAEFEEMKKHALYGYRILENSVSTEIQMGAVIALYHHEKWNGKGYPNGIKGEEIPIVARIVGLIDMFDALTSKRPYKNPYPLEFSVDIIKAESGQSLDPGVVKAFLKNLEEIIAIKKEVNASDYKSISEYKLSDRDQEVTEILNLCKSR